MDKRKYASGAQKRLEKRKREEDLRKEMERAKHLEKQRLLKEKLQRMVEYSSYHQVRKKIC